MMPKPNIFQKNLPNCTDKLSKIKKRGVFNISF